MSDLSTLERAVMNKLLEGEDDVLSILRRQLEEAKVSERRMTGVGFYLTFAIPNGVSRLPERPTVRFGDVHAEIAKLTNGAGFLLYLQNGCLHVLEGYTYDEPWPSETERFKLRYDRGEMRDLEKIRALLHGPGT
jgi:hypothetical protein